MLGVKEESSRRRTKDVRFESYTKVQLLELPSGNLFLSLHDSHDLFKICIDSNVNMQIDRIRLNDSFFTV